MNRSRKRLLSGLLLPALLLWALVPVGYMLDVHDGRIRIVLCGEAMGAWLDQDPGHELVHFPGHAAGHDHGHGHGHGHGASQDSAHGNDIGNGADTARDSGERQPAGSDSCPFAHLPGGAPPPSQLATRLAVQSPPGLLPAGPAIPVIARLPRANPARGPPFLSAA